MSKEFKWDDGLVMRFAIKWLNDRVGWAIMHDYAAAPVPIQIELEKYKSANMPKEEAQSNDSFKWTWTDELAMQYCSFYRYATKFNLEEFKQSHTPKPKKLFTTEDGKDIFKGDDWWVVHTHTDWSIDAVESSNGHEHNPNYKGKRFSTKEAAEKYIADNKPQKEVFNDDIPKRSSFMDVPPFGNHIGYDKLYTPHEVDELCERAFNESRLTHPIIGVKHKDYQDYKQQLNQQKP